MVRLLRKQQIDILINIVHSDEQKACLKINDCFTFCNETHDRILVQAHEIREKILLIKRSINSRATCLLTKIVVNKIKKLKINRIN